MHRITFWGILSGGITSLRQLVGITEPRQAQVSRSKSLSIQSRKLLTSSCMFGIIADKHEVDGQGLLFVLGACHLPALCPPPPPILRSLAQPMQASI